MTATKQITTGERFLDKHRGKHLAISDSARKSLEKHIGFTATRAVSMAIFRRASMMRSTDGHHWFKFRVFSIELVATVVERGDHLEWIHTEDLRNAYRKLDRGESKVLLFHGEQFH